MNKAIELFRNISERLYLNINASKCIAMLVEKEILDNIKPNFKLGNISIPVKDTIRYLVFQLHSRFKLLDHMDIVKESLGDFTAYIERTGC